MKPQKHTPESAVSLFLEKLGEFGASGSEVDRSADRLLRRLEVEFEKGLTSLAHARGPSPSRFWLRWASVATAVVVLAASVMLFRIENPTSIARVESGTVETLEVGQPIEGNTMLRAGANGAMVVLADSTGVELSPKAGFSIARSSDGIELRLADGSGIINAAKQRGGHFSVRTRDCLVSVTGTVFSVRSESAGSRVSVLEGEVRVENGGVVHTLARGDQIATSPVLGSLAIEQEIRWSRRAPGLVALLRGTQKVSESRSVAQDGIIRGHIRNADGSPAASVRVALAHPDAVDVLMHIAQTDKDGAFQLTDIAPGSYVVVGGSVARPTYYPATLDLKDARVISIAAGSIVSGIDVAIVSPLVADISSAVLTRTNDKYRAAEQEFQTPRDARERLLIERGLLSAPVGPDLVVTGRVVVDGQHRWPDFRFLVRVEFKGLLSTMFWSGGVSGDGTFRSSVQIPPNLLSQVEARVAISGREEAALPDDYYVKSISSGVDNLLFKPLRVDGTTPPEVVIELGVGQRIDGNVRREDGRPAGNVRVRLEPRDPANSDRLTRTAVTDQNGDFTLRGVAPGEYSMSDSIALTVGQEKVPPMNLVRRADQTLTKSDRD
jgi:5-hydroxyisourate hydrolase-like protein (transthyretin family)